jgi:hypothetical protein
MAYTDAQKTRRLELENQQTPLTPAERLLLAALNDLRDADISGDNIKGCEEMVRVAEDAANKEKKGVTIVRVEEKLQVDGKDIVPGGHAVETMVRTLVIE